MADISEVRGNLRANLSSSITDTDTSLTVDDEFTSKTVPSDGYLAIGEQQDFVGSTFEVVRYSGFTRNGDGTSTFSSLTRGLDNTSASSWDSGITVGTNIPGNLLARIPQQQESLDMGANSITNLFAILGSAQSSAPSSPSAGDLYIDDGTNTNSGNETLRIYNGTNWVDLALVSELFGGSHSDLSGIGTDDHHTDPTAGTGITDEGTNQFGLNVVQSSSVTLSSGVATVSTGITTAGATLMLALGISDPNADCEIAGTVFWDDSAGENKIKIKEIDTSVGNPTVNYDVIRVS